MGPRAHRPRTGRGPLVVVGALAPFVLVAILWVSLAAPFRDDGDAARGAGAQATGLRVESVRRDDRARLTITGRVPEGGGPAMVRVLGRPDVAGPCPTPEVRSSGTVALPNGAVRVGWERIRGRAPGTALRTGRPFAIAGTVATRGSGAIRLCVHLVRAGARPEVLRTVRAIVPSDVGLTPIGVVVRPVLDGVVVPALRLVALVLALAAVAWAAAFAFRRFRLIRPRTTPDAPGPPAVVPVPWAKGDLPPLPDGVVVPDVLPWMDGDDLPGGATAGRRGTEDGARDTATDRRGTHDDPRGSAEDPREDAGEGRRRRGDDDPRTGTRSGGRGTGDDDPRTGTRSGRRGTGDDDPRTGTRSGRRGTRDGDPRTGPGAGPRGTGDDDPRTGTRSGRRGTGDDDPQTGPGAGRRGTRDGDPRTGPGAGRDGTEDDHVRADTTTDGHRTDDGHARADESGTDDDAWIGARTVQKGTGDGSRDHPGALGPDPATPRGTVADAAVAPTVDPPPALARADAHTLAPADSRAPADPRPGETTRATAAAKGSRREARRRAKRRRTADAAGEAYDPTEPAPRHVRAWSVGSAGERLAAERFAALAGGYPGVHVLHDRRVPSRAHAALDHVLVGPAGVIVAATKHWHGTVRIADERLFVRGFDRTKAIDGVCGQVSSVRSILAASGLGAVPVSGVLHWTRPGGASLDGSLELRGVPLLDATATMLRAVDGGVLGREGVRRVVAVLERGLPPAE